MNSSLKYIKYLKHFPNWVLQNYIYNIIIQINFLVNTETNFSQNNFLYTGCISYLWFGIKIYINIGQVKKFYSENLKNY